MAYPESQIGLGIDAGGTQTRWALATADGGIVAEGAVGGLSALQMTHEEGRAKVRRQLTELAREVLARGRPQRIRFGVTGFGGEGAALQAVLSGLFELPLEDIILSNDIEIAYLTSLAPGEGYLIYAGTGSIGAFIDSDGTFHRAGGRGVVLDDGGGGFWIAREALRHVWRNEDEQPGRWHASRLSRAVFAHIGSDDWAASREFIYTQERGAVGKLALAVAASAEFDPVAADILNRAGEELARLAQALISRHGLRPVVLAGRASTLHPLILASMREVLGRDVPLTHAPIQPHHGAARIAASLLTAPSR